MPTNLLLHGTEDPLFSLRTARRLQPPFQVRAWLHSTEAARSAGREGCSPAALAHAIAQQAYVLAELDELASAAQLAEYARSVAGTAVPPLLMSWLWAVQGELYAARSDARACRRAFEAAERLLAKRGR